jgi:hypothetical protein
VNTNRCWARKTHQHSGFWWVPLIIASACEHRPEIEAAAALKDLLAIDPDFAMRVILGPLLNSV